MNRIVDILLGKGALNHLTAIKNIDS